MPNPDNDILTRVADALGNQRYARLTVRDIAQQTNLSPDQVLAALSSLAKSGVTIRSAAVSAEGEDLYTSRKNYRQTTPLGRRLVAAVLNRPL